MTATQPRSKAAALKELDLKVGDVVEGIITGAHYNVILDDYGYLAIDSNNSSSKLRVSEGVGQYKVVSRAEAPKVLEVGGSYKLKNGERNKCILVEGDRAWMLPEMDYNGHPAYVWGLDGGAISLGRNNDYDVDWEPTVETMKLSNVPCLCVEAGQDVHYIPLDIEMVVDVVDGKPDWSTLSVDS